MDRLGDLLLRQSHFAEAEPLLREALAQRRALVGTCIADTAESMDHLATLFQERAEYGVAERAVPRSRRGAARQCTARITRLSPQA